MAPRYTRVEAYRQTKASGEVAGEVGQATGTDHEGRRVMAKRGDRISKMPGRDLWRARYTVQTETGPKRKTIYGKSYEDVRKALTQAMADADKGLNFDAGAKTLEIYLE